MTGGDGAPRPRLKDSTGPRLVESVLPVAVEDGVWLVRGHEVLRVQGPIKPLTDAVELLRRGLTADQAPDDRTRAVHRHLLLRLAAKDWLAGHDPDFGRGTAHERQIGYLTLFGGNAAVLQGGISKARVAILGVGGVGGVIAQHLAGAGVSELWLIDHDRVALHNLNRQFLAAVTDVGKPKAEVVADSLVRLAPGMRVHLVDARVTSESQLEPIDDGIDLLVVAADTPPDIVTVAWQWAKHRDVPICTAAVGLGTGYWGPLLVPDDGHCWPCFEARRRLLFSRSEFLADAAAVAEPALFWAHQHRCSRTLRSRSAKISCYARLLGSKPPWPYSLR